MIELKSILLKSSEDADLKMCKLINYVEQGEEIVTLRKLMQVKAAYIAHRCGKDKGNYSKMENGYADNTEALALVRTMYNVWVQNEILDLDNRIEYLKSLIK